MSTKTDLYIPQRQVRTLWFLKEGDESDQPELSVTIRADLLIDELESLTWSDRDEEGKPMVPAVEDVRERLAPFVLDWNVGVLKNGKAVKADPPAKAGGGAFTAIAETYTWRILGEVKHHNSGAVRASFLPKSKRSAPPSGDTNASEKGT